MAVTLHDLLTEQLVFQRYILGGRAMSELPDAEREDFLRRQVLGVIDEICEFLNETNWKMHKQAHPIDRAKMIEELVDAQKYLLNCLVYAGVSFEEFMASYTAKSQVVWERARKEFLGQESQGGIG